MDKAKHGTLLSGTSNIVIYTPEVDFTGPDKFTYKATDSQGADSNVATVAISVTAPPKPVPMGRWIRGGLMIYLIIIVASFCLLFSRDMETRTKVSELWNYNKGYNEYATTKYNESKLKKYSEWIS